jgi:hypothetical protein
MQHGCATSNADATCIGSVDFHAAMRSAFTDLA